MNENEQSRPDQVPVQQTAEVEYGPDVPLAVRLERELQHLSS